VAENTFRQLTESSIATGWDDCLQDEDGFGGRGHW